MLIGLGVLLGLCCLCVGASAASNQNLPKPAADANLSDLDLARLAEALQLRAQLGDGIWPGWGSANIPIVIWNRAHEFLMDYEGTPPSEWSRVSEAGPHGDPYYRRTAGDPQNFAVAIGDGWAASMATKSETDAFLIEQFREMFPPPIEQIFPYRLIIQPSETQIGGVLHETFHVLQIQRAADRLQAAESAHRSGEQYEQVAGDFRAEWKAEVGLLVDALQAGSRGEKVDLVRQFLSARDARRRDSHLDPELVAYERWLEWEEGTARYIELASLKAAHETTGYMPLREMGVDPDFHAYESFDRRWSQELLQMRLQTSAGEEAFYASGMTQAFLLDALQPDWKEHYWQEGVFLEDLLRRATGQG